MIWWWPSAELYHSAKWAAPLFPYWLNCCLGWVEPLSLMVPLAHLKSNGYWEQNWHEWWVLGWVTATGMSPTFPPNEGWTADYVQKRNQKKITGGFSSPGVACWSRTTCNNGMVALGTGVKYLWNHWNIQFHWISSPSSIIKAETAMSIIQKTHRWWWVLA